MLFDGRWHSEGTRVVYTASNLALAALEQLVHAGRRLWELDFAVIAIEIDESIKVDRIDERLLPASWEDQPSHATLRRIGDAWVANGLSVGLSVPSAVIPLESNVLLNPGHPDFANLTMSAPAAFRFDRRLFQLVHA